MSKREMDNPMRQSLSPQALVEPVSDLHQAIFSILEGDPDSRNVLEKSREHAFGGMNEIRLVDKTGKPVEIIFQHYRGNGTLQDTRVLIHTHEAHLNRIGATEWWLNQQFEAVLHTDTNGIETGRVKYYEPGPGLSSTVIHNEPSVIFSAYMEISRLHASNIKFVK